MVLYIDFDSLHGYFENYLDESDVLLGYDLNNRYNLSSFVFQIAQVWGFTLIFAFAFS